MLQTQKTIGREHIPPPSGYTLIEVVITLVILAIVALYALPRIPSTDSITLRSQAEKFASDLRRAQILATARGTSLCVRVDSLTAYSVNIPSPPALDCGPTATPLSDSISNQPVAGVLVNQTSFTASPATALLFNSLGQPNASASYTLALSGAGVQGAGVQVNVEATTGRVSVN